MDQGAASSAALEVGGDRKEETGRREEGVRGKELSPPSRREEGGIDPSLLRSDPGAKVRAATATTALDPYS